MSLFDRRRLMGMMGAGWLAGGPLGALAAEGSLPRNLDAAPRFADHPFSLGVASGDPAPDGFVIWTRLAPRPLEPHGGMAMRPVIVAWEVAASESFETVVARGEALAHPELGHSVHVEVAGLAPGRPYWYRFHAGSETSAVGRSQTLPAPGARLDRLRFAVAGCQHYEQGLFTAWRCIAQEPVDFVFHYGDYIYEGRDHGPGAISVNGVSYPPVRRHLGNEIYSLDDYRQRYALYKSDADLQAAHAAAPFWVSFDDHEIDNNWAGDHDQDDTPPEVFAFRRAAAMQAYYEHMPLRRNSMPDGGHMRMYRAVRYGDLMSAFVLDTRQYRSDQLYGDKNAPQGPEVFSPDRTMMGAAQESWLFDGLQASASRWNLIAHQVMLMNLAYRKAPGEGPKTYSMDQWSGYMHSRRRLLAHIEAHCPGNVVNVTGDAHRHYAGDLIQDNGDGRVISSEFLATSITSGADGLGDGDAHSRQVREDNPFLKATTDQRGYVLCDVGRDVWSADLKVLSRVMAPGGKLSTYARFAIERGRPGLHHT